MSDSSSTRFELPPPGGVAWLDVSAEDSNGNLGRTRTGPLGLQITPLVQSRAPYFFKGARLRGTRCIWSASTVSGAELYRPPRALSGQHGDGYVHLLARNDCPGSVFDPVGSSLHGALRVIDPTEEIVEQFVANAHLYTLNVPQAAIGIEPGRLAEMFDRTFELTPFQSQLAALGGESAARRCRRTEQLSQPGRGRPLPRLAHRPVAAYRGTKAGGRPGADRVGAGSHRRHHLRTGSRSVAHAGDDRRAAEHFAASALSRFQRHRQPGRADPQPPPRTRRRTAVRGPCSRTSSG